MNVSAKWSLSSVAAATLAALLGTATDGLAGDRSGRIPVAFPSVGLTADDVVRASVARPPFGVNTRVRESCECIFSYFNADGELIRRERVFVGPRQEITDELDGARLPLGQSVRVRGLVAIEDPEQHPACDGAIVSVGVRDRVTGATRYQLPGVVVAVGNPDI